MLELNKVASKTDTALSAGEKFKQSPVESKKEQLSIHEFIGEDGAEVNRNRKRSLVIMRPIPGNSSGNNRRSKVLENVKVFEAKAERKDQASPPEKAKVTHPVKKPPYLEVRQIFGFSTY